MEDLQLYKKINIKSSVHPYTVYFTRSVMAVIEKITLPGDVLIVDKKIRELYPTIFTGINADIILIEPTENAKSYLEIEEVINKIVATGFRKTNKLIAIGGGITQDITSFISFILYRGVSWVFFPTNLLSQCDSCIGSKLSVNLGQYKNLLGGFFPPNEIYININFLKTLDKKDILSGLGEMLHYFLVNSKEDARLYFEKAPKVKEDLNDIESLIFRSLQIKQAMIEIDEFDQGPRNVFNYGHTFGHALESVTNYVIPHGICVAIGMDLANLISVDLGLISIEERNYMNGLCQLVYSEIKLPEIDQFLYENSLKKDKKNVGDDLGLILTNGIGKTFKRLTPYAKIEKRVNAFYREKQYLTEL